MDTSHNYTRYKNYAKTLLKKYYKLTTNAIDPKNKKDKNVTFNFNVFRVNIWFLKNESNDMSINTIKRALNSNTISNHDSNIIIKKAKAHQNLFSHLGYGLKWLTTTLISLFNGSKISRDEYRKKEILNAVCDIHNNLPAFDEISTTTSLHKNEEHNYEIKLKEKKIYICSTDKQAETLLYKIENEETYNKIKNILPNLLKNVLSSTAEELNNKPDNISINKFLKSNTWEKTQKQIFNDLKAYFKHYDDTQKNIIIKSLYDLTRTKYKFELPSKEGRPEATKKFNNYMDDFNELTRCFWTKLKKEERTLLLSTTQKIYMLAGEIFKSKLEEKFGLKLQSFEENVTRKTEVVKESRFIMTYSTSYIINNDIEPLNDIEIRITYKLEVETNANYERINPYKDIKITYIIDDFKNN